jgi:hypothetical protein
MPDQWTIRGREYVNCNCSWACPCQFNAPSTHGHCQAIGAGVIEKGHFNQTPLDGLHFAMICKWPGEIASGNGQCQLIIDERASAAQREVLGKILRGESTKPGATHFFVFNSTMSKVFDPIYASIDVAIDVKNRHARINVPGVIESKGDPIKNPFTGGDHRVAIELPDGFEYTHAEIGRGTSKSSGKIPLELNDSYGQFCELHMNQDGVIR